MQLKVCRVGLVVIGGGLADVATSVRGIGVGDVQVVVHLLQGEDYDELWSTRSTRPLFSYPEVVGEAGSADSFPRDGNVDTG